MHCPNCGAQVAEGGKFCPSCGSTITQAPVSNYAQPVQGYSQPVQNAPVRPAKSPSKAPIIAAIALVAVVILVVGIVLSSMTGGPMVKIGSALSKTVEKGNLTATFEVDVDGETMEGTAMIDVNYEEQEIMMYCEMEADGDEVVVAIYDGYMISGYEYDGDMYYSMVDISDTIDDAFDSYEENTEEFDMQDFLDELDDNLGGELSDYLDFGELEISLKNYGKKLNSEKWLKENAGYSKSSKSGVTYYTFEPGLYDFCMASVTFLENAFEDEDDYEDMLDAIDDVENDMDDCEVIISIGVKSGYIANLEAEIDIDGDTVEIVGEITDVGKTEIDVELLEEMLEEAEDQDYSYAYGY